MNNFVNTLTESLRRIDSQSLLHESYSLEGLDGNAFALMGYTANAMKECGMNSEIPAMRKAAMSRDYNHLITVCNDYINRCNQTLDENQDNLSGWEDEGLEDTPRKERGERQNRKTVRYKNGVRLDDTINESVDEGIKSLVYNALESIAIRHDVTEREMEDAVEWFMIHFYTLNDKAGLTERWEDDIDSTLDSDNVHRYYDARGSRIITSDEPNYDRRISPEESRRNYQRNVEIYKKHGLSAPRKEYFRTNESMLHSRLNEEEDTDLRMDSDKLRDIAKKSLNEITDEDKKVLDRYGLKK